MATSVEAVIAAIDAFKPVEDGSINVEKLYELLGGFGDLSNREIILAFKGVKQEIKPCQPPQGVGDSLNFG